MIVDFPASAMVNTVVITALVLLGLYTLSHIYDIVILCLVNNRFRQHNSKTFFIPFFPLLKYTFYDLALPQFLASENININEVTLMAWQKRKQQLEEEERKKEKRDTKEAKLKQKQELKQKSKDSSVSSSLSLDQPQQQQQQQQPSPPSLITRNKSENAFGTDEGEGEGGGISSSSGTTSKEENKTPLQRDTSNTTTAATTNTSTKHQRDIGPTTSVEVSSFVDDIIVNRDVDAEEPVFQEADEKREEGNSTAKPSPPPQPLQQQQPSLEDGGNKDASESKANQNAPSSFPLPNISSFLNGFLEHGLSSGDSSPIRPSNSRDKRKNGLGTANSSQTSDGTMPAGTISAVEEKLPTPDPTLGALPVSSSTTNMSSSNSSSSGGANTPSVHKRVRLLGTAKQYAHAALTDVSDPNKTKLSKKKASREREEFLFFNNTEKRVPVLGLHLQLDILDAPQDDTAATTANNNNHTNENNSTSSYGQRRGAGANRAKPHIFIQQKRMRVQLMPRTSGTSPTSSLPASSRKRRGSLNSGSKPSSSSRNSRLGRAVYRALLPLTEARHQSIMEVVIGQEAARVGSAAAAGLTSSAGNRRGKMQLLAVYFTLLSRVNSPLGEDPRAAAQAIAASLPTTMSRKVLRRLVHDMSQVQLPAEVLERIATVRALRPAFNTLVLSCDVLAERHLMRLEGQHRSSGKHPEEKSKSKTTTITTTTVGGQQVAASLTVLPKSATLRSQRQRQREQNVQEEQEQLQQQQQFLPEVKSGGSPTNSSVPNRFPSTQINRTRDSYGREATALAPSATAIFGSDTLVPSSANRHMLSANSSTGDFSHYSSNYTSGADFGMPSPPVFYNHTRNNSVNLNSSSNNSAISSPNPAAEAGPLGGGVDTAAFSASAQEAMNEFLNYNKRRHAMMSTTAAAAAAALEVDGTGSGGGTDDDALTRTASAASAPFSVNQTNPNATSESSTAYDAPYSDRHKVYRHKTFQILSLQQESAGPPLSLGLEKTASSCSGVAAGGGGGEDGGAVAKASSNKLKRAASKNSGIAKTAASPTGDATNSESLSLGSPSTSTMPDAMTAAAVNDLFTSSIRRDGAPLAATSFMPVRIAFIVGGDRSTLLRATTISATRTFSYDTLNYLCFFGPEEEKNSLRRHLARLEELKQRQEQRKLLLEQQKQQQKEEQERQRQLLRQQEQQRRQEEEEEQTKRRASLTMTRSISSVLEHTLNPKAAGGKMGNAGLMAVPSSYSAAASSSDGADGDTSSVPHATVRRARRGLLDDEDTSHDGASPTMPSGEGVNSGSGGSGGDIMQQNSSPTSFSSDFATRSATTRELAPANNNNNNNTATLDPLSSNSKSNNGSGKATTLDDEATIEMDEKTLPAEAPRRPPWKFDQSGSGTAARNQSLSELPSAGDLHSLSSMPTVASHMQTASFQSLEDEEESESDSSEGPRCADSTQSRRTIAMPSLARAPRHEPDALLRTPSMDEEGQLDTGEKEVEADKEAEEQSHHSNSTHSSFLHQQLSCADDKGSDADLLSCLEEKEKPTSRHLMSKFSATVMAAPAILLPTSDSPLSPPTKTQQLQLQEEDQNENPNNATLNRSSDNAAAMEADATLSGSKSNMNNASLSVRSNDHDLDVYKASLNVSVPAQMYLVSKLPRLRRTDQGAGGGGGGYNNNSSAGPSEGSEDLPSPANISTTMHLFDDEAAETLRMAELESGAMSELAIDVLRDCIEGYDSSVTDSLASSSSSIVSMKEDDDEPHRFRHTYSFRDKLSTRKKPRRHYATSSQPPPLQEDDKARSKRRKEPPRPRRSRKDNLGSTHGVPTGVGRHRHDPKSSKEPHRRYNAHADASQFSINSASSASTSFDSLSSAVMKKRKKWMKQEKRRRQKLRRFVARNEQVADLPLSVAVLFYVPMPPACDYNYESYFCNRPALTNGGADSSNNNNNNNNNNNSRRFSMSTNNNSTGATKFGGGAHDVAHLASQNMMNAFGVQQLCVTLIYGATPVTIVDSFKHCHKEMLRREALRARAAPPTSSLDLSINNMSSTELHPSSGFPPTRFNSALARPISNSSLHSRLTAVGGAGGGGSTHLRGEDEWSHSSAHVSPYRLDTASAASAAGRRDDAESCYSLTSPTAPPPFTWHRTDSAHTEVFGGGGGTCPSSHLNNSNAINVEPHRDSSSYLSPTLPPSAMQSIPELRGPPSWLSNSHTVSAAATGSSSRRYISRNMTGMYLSDDFFDGEGGSGEGFAAGETTLPNSRLQTRVRTMEVITEEEPTQGECNSLTTRSSLSGRADLFGKATPRGGDSNLSTARDGGESDKKSKLTIEKEQRQSATPQAGSGSDGPPPPPLRSPQQSGDAEEDTSTANNNTNASIKSDGSQNETERKIAAQEHLLLPDICVYVDDAPDENGVDEDCLDSNTNEGAMGHDGEDLTAAGINAALNNNSNRNINVNSVFRGKHDIMRVLQPQAIPPPAPDNPYAAAAAAVEAAEEPEGVPVPVSLLYIRVGDALFVLTEVVDKTFVQYREERLTKPSHGGDEEDEEDEDEDEDDNSESEESPWELPSSFGASTSRRDTNKTLFQLLEKSLQREVRREKRGQERRLELAHRRRSRSRHAAVSTLGFREQLYSLSATPGTRRQRVHMCWSCLSAEATTVFLPCGHFAVCTNCANGSLTCCVCKADILSTVNLHLR